MSSSIGTRPSTSAVSDQTRFARRMRWIKWCVLLACIGVAVLTAPLADKLTGAETGDEAGFLPRSSQATKVLDRERAAGLGDTSTAVAVYQRRTGLTPGDQQTITQARDASARLGRTGPIETAPDSRTAAFTLTIAGAADSAVARTAVTTLRRHTVPG